MSLPDCEVELALLGSHWANWVLEPVVAEELLAETVEDVVAAEPPCCIWISIDCISLPICWKALVRSLVDSELALLLPELLASALKRSVAWPLLTPGGAPATNSLSETWPLLLVSSLLKYWFS